jgi:hypothetical protein
MTILSLAAIPVEIAKGCPGLELGQTVEVRAFATDAFENERAQVKAADLQRR